MFQTCYIYNGPGTSEQSIKHTEHTLRGLIDERYTIQKISPNEVKKGMWLDKTTLFIMPGGADTLYSKYLNSIGNKNIKLFVENGGAYLGFCAGAYYGSQKIEFSLGTAMEIVEDRELAFFPGTAVGPTLAPYDYGSESGARAASVHWNHPNGSFPLGDIFLMYYNGGCHFEQAHRYKTVQVLAYYHSYEHSKAAAIIQVAVGKGAAILSGAHCEYDPTLLDSQDPFLGPIKKKLQNEDKVRITLMADLLRRLGVQMKCGL